MAEERRSRNRTGSRRVEYDVLVPARGLGAAALMVLATIALIFTIDRAGTVFSLLVASLVVTVLAAPLVDWASRRVPRALALVVITLGGLAVVIAVVGLVAWDLNRQSGHLAEALHEAVARLRPGTRAAKLAADVQLDRRIDSTLGHAASRLFVGSDNPLGVAALVGKTVVVAVLAAFLVVGGRDLASSAIKLARRASIRRQFERATTLSVARAGSFLRRMIAVSLIHGLVVLGVCKLWQLPASITLAAWVSSLTLVPILGGILAWAPIVALATVDDRHSVVVLTAIAVACIVGDSLARRRWANRPLHLGPLLTVVGLAVGVNLMGLPGVLGGILLVALLAAAFTSQETDLDAAVVDLVDDRPDRALAEAEGVEVERVAIDGERREPRPILRLGLSTRSMIAAGALAVGLWIAFDVVRGMGSVIVWFAIAGFVAMGIDRPVSVLERKVRVPRVAGIAIVLGVLAALVAVVAIVGGPSIADSARSTAHDAPKTVASLERLPLVGKLIEDNHASEKIQEFLSSIPDRISSSDAVDRISRAAGDSLLGLGWVLTVLIAGLLDGPRLVLAVRRRIPAPRRIEAIRFGRAAYRALSNVVAASFFVAALNGTVVMMLALALGVPLAPILGLWAAFWNFIPQIGGFVGALPMVALAFGQGPWHGVIALVVFVTYQTFENHVLQPLIGSRVVDIPPLVFLVGALLGGTIAGFVGALLAGPVLGVAKLAIDEIRGPQSQRVEDRAPPADRITAS